MADDEVRPVGIVKFIDESENFSHGFECGKIWKMLNNKEQIIELPVYIANCEMIERMCTVFHKRAVFKPYITLSEKENIWCVLSVEPLLKIVK